MASTVSERVRKRRDALRAAGLRPVVDLLVAELASDTPGGEPAAR